MAKRKGLSVNASLCPLPCPWVDGQGGKLALVSTAPVPF